MRVRIKTLLLPVGAFVGLMALSSAAAAQCAGTCQPPPPPTPPPLPGIPCGSGGCGGPVVPPINPCAGGGCTTPGVPPVFIGGGSVNVNVNVNNNTNTNTNTNNGGGVDPRTGEGRIRVGNRTGINNSSTIIIGGGGGAYFNVDQPYPTTIQGLNVEGSAMQMVQVPYSASRRMEKRVRIQAVCIDDRARPHPASQVRPGKDVAADYEGELYRCIAGTRLQWTIQDLEGGHGETIDCNKREALWFGQGGQLQCRPEKQERDCNERSLLRRYGAGVKELVMIREETYTAYREEAVQASGMVASGAMMMLDGGVGGRVF